MTERPLKPLPFTQTGSGARAVVFIHGVFDEGGFWRRTVEALETRYLALVTFDLPGMGKVADDPGPFSLERLAQAVTSLVDPLNRPTVLVGHSMGAQIAELVAAMRPRRITGLVLLSPVPLGGMALPEVRATAFRSFGGIPQRRKRTAAVWQPSAGCRSCSCRRRASYTAPDDSCGPLRRLERWSRERYGAKCG